MPSCSICNDTGFIYPQDNRGVRTARLCPHIEERCLCGGQAPFFVYSEKLDAMLPCHCREPRLRMLNIIQRYDKAAIPPKYQWKFFEDFDMNWVKDSESSTQLFFVLDWAHHFIDHYNDPDVEKKGMFLSGRPGSGKTLLCTIILNELMKRYNTDCRYAKVSRDFLGKIQASFSPADQNYGQGRNIMQRLQNTDVLVLDDFGVQKDSPWTEAVLYDLIDSRYENNRLTLFTSNKQPEDFKDMSNGRIFSRLNEITRFFKLNIPDYRMRMHGN